MLFPILVIVACVVLVVGVPVLVYRASRFKQQATSVKTGTIEAVVAGDSLLYFFVNVPGYFLFRDGDLDLILTEEEAGARGNLPRQHFNILEQWLQETWGIWWVSILYPARKIHRFSIVKSRFRSTTKTQGENGASVLGQIQIDENPAEVDFLLWKIPIPFGFSKVETKDKLTVNIVVQCIFQVRIPRIAIFDLQGKLYTTLQEYASKAIVQWLKSRNLTDFVESPEGEPVDGKTQSPFAEMCKGVVNAALPTTGVELFDIIIPDYEPADDKTRAALAALELAELEGRAKIRIAELNLTAAQKDAEASAAPAKELVNAYGGNVELANRDRVSANLGKVGTLVIGNGGNTGPILGLGDGDKQKEIIVP